MSFSVSITGHIAGKEETQTMLVKTALEHLAQELKAENGSGTISLTMYSGTKVEISSLSFHPGDNLAWD